MCQTQVISKHIGRIGRKSFDRRMRIASPLFVERRGELARLLNEVDKLSDRLHEEFPTISENDYRLFGPELKVMISTLKALRQDSLTRKELKPYNDRMRQQIADLEELDLADRCDIPTEINRQNRNGCLCLACKKEMLTQKHPCAHKCLYCYWKD